MQEATFDKLGREELSHIEERLADVDPDDIEVSSSDGMLTMTLRDGVKVVVNTHRAARQIWMAAVASAWHFDPPADAAEGRWCTPDGRELRATLAGVIRERLGLEIQL